MRRILTVALVSAIVLGIAGILVSVGGESYARSQLPPDLNSPEAIQYYYDGAVCLGCQIIGAAIFFIALALGGMTSLVWIVYEFTEPRERG